MGLYMAEGLLGVFRTEMKYLVSVSFSVENKQEGTP